MKIDDCRLKIEERVESFCHLSFRPPPVRRDKLREKSKAVLFTTQLDFLPLIAEFEMTTMVSFFLDSLL
jgi:hypothetical protein